MKVNKILNSYKTYYEQKQQAKAEGISYEELIKREKALEKPKSKLGKKKIKAKKGVEIVIKMKGKDGAVINFDENEGDE
jgi:hypothetical protein